MLSFCYYHTDLLWLLRSCMFSSAACLYFKFMPSLAFLRSFVDCVVTEFCRLVMRFCFFLASSSACFRLLYGWIKLFMTICRLTMFYAELLFLLTPKWGFKLKRHKRQWRDQYQELMAYKQIHGKCNVPFCYEHNKLGQWVKTQKDLYKAGKLL